MTEGILSKLEEGFISSYQLWTEEQKAAAQQIIADMEEQDFLIVRIAWVDHQGVLKSKRVPKEGFIKTLKNGLNISTGTFIFDSAYAIVFNPFIPGGGYGVPEMTGCPNITLVPDPLSFKMIPWAERQAIVMCDIYFNDGQPVPYSVRQVYRQALEKLDRRGMDSMVGLEVEWYLTKLEDPMLAVEHNGDLGTPPAAPKVSTVEHGLWYQAEPHNQEIHQFLDILAENLLQMGIPLRTMENELGPGQYEFVFDPLTGMEAADAMMYFKIATKQISRKYGYMATFMCRPHLKGFSSSGWHLHQSVIDKETGKNLFMDDRQAISEFGRHYIGGVLENAGAASVFSIPTINGYKRLKPNSLAPTSTVWGIFNRGVMINVHGSGGDPASHFENRIGEPGANPYLYMASQIVSGLYGVDHKIDPGEPSVTPYDNDQTKLPTSLREAIEELKKSEMFKEEFGESFINYIAALKESEVGRYLQYVKEENIVNADVETTEWEQREYFEVL
ncbi:glutamine synthetase [Bacillus sp. V3B]|uniref:glutamine synthetase family protein n=1 Tax=Bacillus sp. V3B TaxID=2804915 RepID=UPI002109A304|nr:glutamine synthetase family protein [Bacillus sp. V3B]MCQ6277075.1 glutamine synthetase [Bacillus sp. V3B]